LHTGLFLGRVKAILLSFPSSRFTIGIYFVPIFYGVLVFSDEHVLGRKHHVRGAKKRIRARGEYLKWVSGRKCECDLCTCTPSDPLTLRLFDELRPVKILKIIDKSVGVVRDTQFPFFHLFLLNLGATTF